ncbi:hypothetical protein [Pseudoalteromonas sp. ZZD1]|uniref:hypothetical protein n=1 Tax=Pseudoalteromonas sp. ZZD1 TaxID=3139395 RepID=UPI003BAC7A27
MHPRYAAIFGIENLELNQHFRSDTAQHASADIHLEQSTEKKTVVESQNNTLELNAVLLADLNRAVAPHTINHVIQADAISWHNDTLSLPSAQLKPEHKRALWALMSKTRDNL